MNRIEQKFQGLKKQGRKAFIAYITAGDPDLKTTEALVLAFEKSGVDIIELGIPFSDPMADGKTIQAAGQRALKKGATLKKIFETVKRLRRKTSIPIIFMLYYNSVFHYGDEKFAKTCAAIGIDGLIIPDLPPEEAGVLRQAAAKHGVATIFFIAPTTTEARMKANSAASAGFVYYVSLTGVTGTKQASAQEVVNNIRKAKQLTSKPICAGFGISTPQQVKAIAAVADGVIVGSAIVKVIAQYQGRKDLVSAVSKYVTSLARPLIPGHLP